MKFEVTILGSGSATPTLHRNPTSQYIYLNERHILIDCGEGTQLQLRKNKIKFSKISHILISHLHGDHYLGLIGLISSFHLLGRTKELHVYGPKPLKEIIRLNLKASGTYLKYPIFIHEIETKEPQILFEDKVLSVSSFPLKHRVPCMGFRIQEKEKPLSVRKNVIEEYNLGIEQIKQIKEGEDIVLADGKVLLNSSLTLPPEKLRSYAFCSDTAYYEEIISHIKNVTTLYHEATFLSDMNERAKQTQHSTAAQAATIAKKANAEQLLLGHFSARYKDTQPFIDEAKSVFSNTFAVVDDQKFEIN